MYQRQHQQCGDAGPKQDCRQTFRAQPRPGSRKQLGVTQADAAEAAPGAVDLIRQDDEGQSKTRREDVPDDSTVENRRCENPCEYKRNCNDVWQTELLSVDFAQDDKG